MMRARAPKTEVLETSDGTTAELARDGHLEVLRVRNAEGALVFEHRPAEGRSVVYAPAGDLCLRAARGRIDLDAAEGVHVRSPRRVSVESGEGVQFLVTDVANGVTTLLDLARRGVAFVAPRLEARFDAAEVHAKDGRLRGTDLATHARHLRTKVEVLETVAGRILERAQESYRETAGLSQTKAERLRLVAEKTLHALGDRTLLKAHRDMKLRAEKIYIA